jgi:hypothetical protein
MKIDIFATTRYSHIVQSFGIYDDPLFPEEPAKIIPFEDIKAVATIENKNNWNIYFIPIDKNIIYYKPDSKYIESQCDVLLICARPLKKYDFYFIELKDDRTTAWIPKGVGQLKNTILAIKSCYSLSCISKKCAFLANKKHPSFHYNHKPIMAKFRKETGFRLNICARIPIR